MGIGGVDVIHHLLWIVETGIHELHGIPQIVAAPVLPVLDNAVEWQTELTIFVDHPGNLMLALVTLARLPESVAPQWKHRHLARDGAHLGYHPVGITAVHEIIVHTVTHL